MTGENLDESWWVLPECMAKGGCAGASCGSGDGVCESLIKQY